MDILPHLCEETFSLCNELIILMTGVAAWMNGCWGWGRAWYAVIPPENMFLKLIPQNHTTMAPLSSVRLPWTSAELSLSGFCHWAPLCLSSYSIFSALDPILQFPCASCSPSLILPLKISPGTQSLLANTHRKHEIFEKPSFMTSVQRVSVSCQGSPLQKCGCSRGIYAW